MIVQGHKFINTRQYEADKSLGDILKKHPALTANPMTFNVAIADILATVEGHQSNDLLKERHTSSVLLKDASHLPFVSRLSHWM